MIRDAELLIFDLDGTLVDSKQDLANAVNATRVWRGLPPLPDEVALSYTGEGAPMLVRRALPDASEADLKLALRYFLDYYRDHMLVATRLYPGVREALDELHAAHIPMAVLTNKPVRFSVTMIEDLDLDLHFFRIYGGNSFPSKKPDPSGIEALLTEAGAAWGATRKKTVMVGDSFVDVLTARNAGVVACGVEWGFMPGTFDEVPPDVRIADLRELSRMVLGSGGQG